MNDAALHTVDVNGKQSDSLSDDLEVIFGQLKLSGAWAVPIFQSSERGKTR